MPCVRINSIFYFKKGIKRCIKRQKYRKRQRAFKNKRQTAFWIQSVFKNPHDSYKKLLPQTFPFRKRSFWFPSSLITNIFKCKLKTNWSFNWKWFYGKRLYSNYKGEKKIKHLENQSHQYFNWRFNKKLFLKKQQFKTHKYKHFYWELYWNFRLDISIRKERESLETDYPRS